MKAIVAYVPVIHAGYLKFFEKYEDSDLYVLGKDFLAEVPQLDRDMRALSPETVAAFARTLSTVCYVGVLTLQNLPTLERYSSIILPSEEISYAFAGKHLSIVRDRLTFDTVFLRWDRMVSTMKQEVKGVVARSLDETERAFMQAALDVSNFSSDWWRRVGAVACRDGKLLAARFNRHYPSEQSPYIVGDPRSNFNAGEFIDHSTALHAEAGLAAAAASSSLSLSGSDVFVTTFPCPPCAALLANCGIRRLFFFEGYSLVAAQEILEKKGVEIIHVVL